MLSARFPELQVPVFLVCISRFFSKCSYSVGILDTLSESEQQQVTSVLADAVVGSEYQFPPSWHPRVVWNILLQFLENIPVPSVITFEVRPLLRSACSDILQLGSSNVSSLLPSVVALLQALPSLNRWVIFEIAHIAASLIDNRRFNLCDPLAISASLGGVLFQDSYTMFSDEPDAKGAVASGFAGLFAHIVTCRIVLMASFKAPPPLGQPPAGLIHGLGAVKEFSSEKVVDIGLVPDAFCSASASGQFVVHDVLNSPLRQDDAKQPIFHVAGVGQRWWFRGEMCAELRAKDGTRQLCLPKNARCFTHLQDQKLVLGGSDGCLLVFDEEGKMMRDPVPFRRIDQPSSGRIPARHVVVTGKYVWAAGDKLVTVYALDTFEVVCQLVEEASTITGFCACRNNDTTTYACTSNGLLLRLILGQNKITRDELKSSVDTLRHLVSAGHVMFSTSERNIIAFHAQRWKQISVIPTGARSGQITCLRARHVQDVNNIAFWELFSGFDDGFIARWMVDMRNELVSPRGHGWKRADAPSAEVLDNTLRDVRTGESVLMEDLDVDRSASLDTEMFGVAFRGRWRGIDVAVREIALDVFTQEDVDDFQAHLVQPVVTHPRMCQLYCLSVSPGKKLTLVTGIAKSTLYALLQEGMMRFRVRMIIAEQVARFLAFIHSMEPPLLHLDLNTASVLLDADLNVLVDDLYGINRVRNLKTSVNSATMTKSQRVLPPEMLVQTPERDLRPAADVYQFGMLLWALLMQENPFHKVLTVAELHERVVVKGERPSIPETCPPILRSTMERCWSERPDERPTISSLLAADIFGRAYVEHAVEDKVGVEFWVVHVCRAGSLMEPASFGTFCQQIMMHCKIDQKTSALLEEMFRSFLVKQNTVSVSDFGELLGRFGALELTPQWVEQLIGQLSAPGMYGAVSGEEADEILNKSKRGEYLIRFARQNKNGFYIHVRGSESIRSYLVIPASRGTFKLKESSSNKSFNTIYELCAHYSSQLGLKTPLEGGVFQKLYAKMFTNKKSPSGIFAKKESVTVVSSAYETSF